MQLGIPQHPLGPRQDEAWPKRAGAFVLALTILLLRTIYLLACLLALILVAWAGVQLVFLLA